MPQCGNETNTRLTLCGTTNLRRGELWLPTKHTLRLVIMTQVGGELHVAREVESPLETGFEDEAQLQVGVAVEVLRQTGFMVVAPFQAGFVVKVLLKLKSLC
jgi:hypothetical protein